MWGLGFKGLGWMLREPDTLLTFSDVQLLLLRVLDGLHGFGLDG